MSATGTRGLLLLALLVPLVARAGEVIELIPDQRASWGATNVFAPITGLFMGGPGYWYKERRIEIDTTPPGAILDLFYVRANFQKGYEQAEAPVTLVLPSRIEAGPRDSITIRALLDGYRQQEVHVKVRSRNEEVMIDLDPLPNALMVVTHTGLSGRESLTFLTKEALTFRLQNSEDGYSVVLSETGETAEARATIKGVSSPLIESLRTQQLGEDLVVRVALTGDARDGSIEVRSRQAVDPVRGVHSFALDFVPADGGVEAVGRARAALDRVGPAAIAGCASAYDQALREQLDPSDLARALTPNGSFTDPYLRAAMKRLGEISPSGLIELIDGSRFNVAVPIELMAAASRASDARGYLALLRAFVAELETPDYRRETLRGLIAPEVGVSRFGTIVGVAEQRESACRTRAS